MAELEWLDDLVWFTIPAGHDANLVLDGYHGYGSIDQGHEELYGLCLSIPSGLSDEGSRVARRLVFEPFIGRDCQVGAWWMCYHQVPAVIKDFKNISLDVLAWNLGGLQITRPCVMAELGEGFPYDA